MIITFSSAIIDSGDFMIDTSNYSDNMALFNFTQNCNIKGKESIAYIFNDNLNYLRSLYNSGKLRPVTYDNIQKTILCGSVYLGYDIYVCPECGKESIIPHRCHSKFCTSCGAKETKKRAALVSSMALDAHHRHIVFTIPKQLRRYFIADRSLLNLLFIAARNTLACVFNDDKYRKNKNKNKNKLPTAKKNTKNLYDYKNDRNKIIFGSVMTLHTFGRDLKWNPHIHCLVCEEAFDTLKEKMRNFSFISYEKLRKTWMYQVLHLLSKQHLKGFRYLKNTFYKELDEGFYVYAKKNENQDDNNVEECVKYITRYTSRPAIAESRIIKYEDDKKMIRWWYNRHEDEKYVEVYEPVEQFLNNLILHCPDENFKMVRYYGFYSNKNKPLLEKIYALYGIEKKKHIKNIKERKKELKRKLEHFKYRTHMIESYAKDPLLCTCGAIMKYEYTYDPFEGGTPNDRHYREGCLNECRRLRLERRRTRCNDS